VASISLNANGNPLHQTDRAQGECLKDTIRVAGEMGVKTVCTMSGDDKVPNWVVSSWPPETQTILCCQWNDVLLPFWSDIVSSRQTTRRRVDCNRAARRPVRL
jgi:hypothetical protein